MRVIDTLATLAALLFASACAQSSVKGPESLVRAKNLAPSRTLSAETIQINRRGGLRQEHLLSYELRPDNLLTVTHALQERGTDRTLARREFRLRPDLASEARASLARMRPPALRGVGSLTRPTGCAAIGDGLAEADELLFIDAKERFGISTIPQEFSCNTAQARLARELISQVLTSLPGSQVAADFANS